MTQNERFNCAELSSFICLWVIHSHQGVSAKLWTLDLKLGFQILNNDLQITSNNLFIWTFCMQWPAHKNSTFITRNHVTNKTLNLKYPLKLSHPFSTAICIKMSDWCSLPLLAKDPTDSGKVQISLFLVGAERMHHKLNTLSCQLNCDQRQDA